MPYGLDDVDRTILYYLSEDARHYSATDIADHVRVSAQTVRNRIRELGENGVIKGYHAHVDFERAEGYLTNLFLCTTTMADRETLAQQALKIPGIIHVREIMTGRTDLRITAVGRDTDELTQIARAISELGIDIEEEDLIRHEHTSPYRPFSPQSEQQTPTITDFMSLTGDAEVAEVTVSDAAPIAETTLEDANQAGILSDDVLVVTIRRDDDVLTPHGETVVQAGDRVTVLSRHGIDTELKTPFAE